MIQLLKQGCCEQLLQFQSNPEVRGRYDYAHFPKEFLDFLPISSKVVLEDIDLSPSPEDDFKSSIDLFERLKHLDRVQANDRRLWVSLTHNIFFKYTKERWKIIEDTSSEVLFRRFHFEGSSLEARMRNSISRLWWGAKITYDETKEDPYELTKVLWSKQDLVQNIVERSYGTYPNVVTALLEVYKENSQLKEQELRFLYTGLNSIGGVKILPMLSKSEVKKEIIKVSEFKDIDLIYNLKLEK